MMPDQKAMLALTIDGRSVRAAPGATILDTARQLGIEIPTLCHLEGEPAVTSCMVCVVKVEGRAALVPACGAPVAEGMVVYTDTDEVRTARRTALELLLGEHVGDCMGPCHVLCPATMDIPQMLRQIAAGDLRAAAATVKADIALPSVLGRICPAPCEKGCRRGQADAPVAICLLKRFVGDADLAAAEPWRPKPSPDTGKRVAVVGAGPAGLAAAFHLRLAGHAVELFDDHDRPGGALQSDVPEEKLPRDVLDAEIAAVERTGVAFRLNTRVDDDALARLRRECDAVLLATGAKQPAPGSVNRKTYRTETEGLFAAGNAIRPKNRMAVRALADGKEAAAAIDQFLKGDPVTGPRRRLNSRIGKLMEGEAERFLEGAGRDKRVTPTGAAGGFTPVEARREALRCMHCDCRKPEACRLRAFGEAYGAEPRRYSGTRRAFEQQAGADNVLYEPGKCIDCGICIRIAAREKEALGLTFIGRGFSVRVGVPFAGSLAAGLARAAARCAAACPTGALSRRDSPA
jgi:ferredoxin